MSEQTVRQFERAANKVDLMAKNLKIKHKTGLRLMGEEIMLDIKSSRPGAGVPVDKGILRNSGRVTGPDVEAVVRLTFGGPAAPYAFIQHERLDFHHPVGEARYLIRGVLRWQPNGASAKAARAELQQAIDDAKNNRNSRAMAAAHHAASNLADAAEAGLI